MLLRAYVSQYREKSRDIEVDLWRFVVLAGSAPVCMPSARQKDGGSSGGRKGARRHKGAGRRQQRHDSGSEEEPEGGSCSEHEDS